MTNIVDLAAVIRSKNSGPFEITFDIMFKDEASYLRTKNSGVITPESVCALYGVDQDKLLTFLWFDKAHAFKFTLLRFISSGSKGERDTYGAQQSAPLLSLEIPEL